jgi:hypothetical protein
MSETNEKKPKETKSLFVEFEEIIKHVDPSNVTFPYSSLLLSRTKFQTRAINNLLFFFLFIFFLQNVAFLHFRFVKVMLKKHNEKADPI